MKSLDQYRSRKWGIFALGALWNYSTHTANTTSAQAALVGNAINLVANGKTLSSTSGLTATNLSSAVTSVFGSWKNLIASSVILDLSLNPTATQINAFFNNQLTSSAATSLANNCSGAKNAGPARYTSNLIQAIQVLANGAQFINVFPSLYALIDGQTSATSGAVANGINILLSTAFQVGGFGALCTQLINLNLNSLGASGMPTMKNVGPINMLTNTVGVTQQSSATQAALTNLLSIAAQSPATTITLTPTLVGQGIFASSTTSINLSIPSGLAQLLTGIGATNLLQNIIPQYVSGINSAKNPFSSALAFLVQAVGAGPLIVAGVQSNQLSQLVGLTNEPTPPTPQQASAYALAQSLIQSAGGIGTVYNLLAPLYGNSPAQTFNALVNFASLQGLLTLAGNSIQTLASSVGGGSTIIQWLAANLTNVGTLIAACSGNLATLATQLGVSVSTFFSETNSLPYIVGYMISTYSNNLNGIQLLSTACGSISQLVTIAGGFAQLVALVIPHNTGFAQLCNVYGSFANMANTIGIQNLVAAFGSFPSLFSAMVANFTNGITLLMNSYGGSTQLATAAGGIAQLISLALSTNKGFTQLIAACGSLANLANTAGGWPQLISMTTQVSGGFAQLVAACGSLNALVNYTGTIQKVMGAAGGAGASTATTAQLNQGAILVFKTITQGGDPAGQQDLLTYFVSIVSSASPSALAAAVGGPIPLAQMAATVPGGQAALIAAYGSLQLFINALGGLPAAIANFGLINLCSLSAAIAPVVSQTGTATTAGGFGQLMQIIGSSSMSGVTVASGQTPSQAGLVYVVQAVSQANMANSFINGLLTVTGGFKNFLADVAAILNVVNHYAANAVFQQLQGLSIFQISAPTGYAKATQLANALAGCTNLALAQQFLCTSIALFKYAP